MQRYGVAATEDTHDHAWASSELAFAILELSGATDGLTRMFALHAAVIVSGLLDADGWAAAEYFEEASRWDNGGEIAGGRERWVKAGFIDYESQCENLDHIEQLLNGQGISATDSWGLLQRAWQNELKRRRAYLVDAWRAKEIVAEPDHLLLDALHLFCNRLGLNLTIECYIYYLVAELLRERASSSTSLSRRHGQ